MWCLCVKRTTWTCLTWWSHVRTVNRPQSEHAPDWASIYGQSNDVVFVLSQHYCVEFANAHEGTSFPGVELGSKLIQSLEPEFRALFALSLERSLHEFRTLQFEFMRTDGPVPRWFSVNINPVRMERDPYLVVALRDNGLGMDLSKYENDLWAPFRRIHQNAQVNGLGMALIRNVVEQSGGRIEVESTLGQGTTFYVYLKNIGAAAGQYALF